MYITQSILDALEEKSFTKAAKIFQENTQTYAPSSYLKRNLAQPSNQGLTDKIAKEMLPNENDRGKSIYYFLMRNDQKRHLDKHFETICQHKTELHLPFFDSLFLEKIH